MSSHGTQAVKEIALTHVVVLVAPQLAGASSGAGWQIAMTGELDKAPANETGYQSRGKRRK